MRKLMALLMLLATFPVAGKAQKNDYSKAYFYMRGMEAYNAEEYDKAAEWFEKETKEHPDNGYAHYMYALMYSQVDKGKALQEAQTALKCLKSDAEWMQYAYRLIAGIYEELDEPAEQEKTLLEAHKASPDNHMVMADIGNMKRGAGDLEGAMHWYGKAAKVRPESGRMHGILASLQLQKAKECEAKGDTLGYESYLTMAEKTIAVATALSETKDNLVTKIEISTERERFGNVANIILSMVDSDDRPSNMNELINRLDAKAHEVWILMLKGAMVHEPNNALFPYMAAMSHMRNSRYGEAFEMLQEVVRVQGADNVSLHGEMAQCLLGMRNGGEALASAERLMASATEPDLSDILFMSKLLYEVDGMPESFFANGLVDRAVAYMDTLVTLAPDNSYAYMNRAELLKQIGKVDAALADMGTAIELDPENAEMYVERGSILYHKKDAKDLARRDFETAVQLLESETADLNKALALAYLGKAEETLKVIGNIEKDLLPSGETYFIIAKAYATLNKLDEAAESMRKALNHSYKTYRTAKECDELKALWAKVDYDTFVKPYITEGKRQMALLKGEVEKESQVTGTTTDIPYTPDGGVCKVKCSINGLPLHFIFDTGASDVTISTVEATFMLKHGYLSEKDISGKQYYQTADGSISAGTTIVLKEVCFGGLTLTDVKASVVESQAAPLLLGQSVFQRLGTIEIDNKAKVIRIKK